MDLPETNKFHCDNAEKFLDEYHKVLTESGTTKKLAERMGVSKRTVQRLYNKHQVPPLDGGKKTILLSDDEFVSIYHEALERRGNYVYIAQKAGCSVTTVQRRAKTLKLPVLNSWGGRRKDSGRPKGSKNKNRDALTRQLAVDQQTNSLEVRITKHRKLRKEDFWHYAGHAFHPVAGGNKHYKRAIHQPGLPLQL